jgi:CBS domain-containing protein
MSLFGSSNFAKLTAADVMTPAPRTCSPFSTVLEAVMIFRDADCGAVPITEDGRPIGVLTDRDVALALADHPDLAMRAVEDVMTRGAVTVRASTPVAQVREVFGDQGVRRLLVVDANDQLVGIISWADIAARLTDDALGDVVSDVVEQP